MLHDIVNHYNRLHHRVVELGEVATLVDLLELNRWNHVDQATETLELRQSLLKDHHQLQLVEEMSTGIDEFLHRKAEMLIERSEGPATAGASDVRSTLKSFLSTYTLGVRYLENEPRSNDRSSLPGYNHLTRCCEELITGCNNIKNVNLDTEPSKFLDQLRTTMTETFRTGMIRMDRTGVEAVPFQTVEDPANRIQWSSTGSLYQLRQVVERLGEHLAGLAVRRDYYQECANRASGSGEGSRMTGALLAIRTIDLLVQQGLVTISVVEATINGL